MKKTRLLYYVLFLIGFAGFSFSYSQIIPFLTDMGFTAIERGYILSLSALIGIVSQFLFGIICDKMQRTKPMLMVSLVILSVSTFITYRLNNPLFSVMLIYSALSVGFFRVTSNLLETWVYTIDEDTRQHFGVIRLFGSIGWALGAFLLGYLIKDFGYPALSLAMFPFLGLMLLLMMPLKDSDYQEASTSFNFKDVGALLRNPQFLLVILVFFWVFLVFNMDALTVIDYMILLGAGTEVIGFKWFLQALVELPLMIFGAALLIRYGLKKIVILATVTFIIRFVGIGLTDNVNLIIAFSGLQLISFPLILLSQKEAVNQQVPVHLRATGHLLMTSITSNIPVILMPLISSWAYSMMEINTFIVVAGISLIIPTLLMLNYKEPKK